MDFVNTDFYCFRIRSEKLCSLLKEFFCFYCDDDMLVSEWLVKADKYIGQDEKEPKKRSVVPGYMTKELNVIDYLIDLFDSHREMGLSTQEEWREVLRFYDPEENENYSEDILYESKLDSDDINKIIKLLIDNKEELSNSITDFAILECTIDGDYSSSAKMFVSVDNKCVCEVYDEDDINDWTGCDSFVEDVIQYDFELEHLSEPIFEEIGFD